MKWNRRQFVAGAAASALFRRPSIALAPLPIVFRQPPPYLALAQFVDAGSDEFSGERDAQALERGLAEWARGAALEVGGGASPCPVGYERVAEGVLRATFGAKESAAAGLTRWRQSLGEIRSARF